MVVPGQVAVIAVLSTAPVGPQFLRTVRDLRTSRLAVFPQHYGIGATGLFRKPRQHAAFNGKVRRTDRRESADHGRQKQDSRPCA